MMDTYPRVFFEIDSTTYRWSGWYGCQLESYEWYTLPAGTKRDLYFSAVKPCITMTIFTTKREGFKVRTTWAVNSSGTHDEHTSRIHALKDSLRSLI